jgi:nitrate reductase gamma subunit
MMIGSIVVLTMTALVGVFVPRALNTPIGTGLGLLYTVPAAVGTGMAVAGAIGLLLRRLRDPALRNYTAPGDIFNLAFFIVAFCTLIAGYAFRPLDAPGIFELAVGALTFDTSLRIPGLLGAGLVLGSLLVAYIPLTHMSHFIAKYFTYHSIKWDDMPTARATEMQKTLAKYLTFRPHWSAPHIQADGTKTWADIATANPTQGGNDK